MPIDCNYMYSDTVLEADSDMLPNMVANIRLYS